MEVDRIAADLVRAEPEQASARVDRGIMEPTHPRATHVTCFDVSYVDVGARHEDHVPARALGVLGPDHHVAAEIAHVRQELERAVHRARAFVVVPKGGGQRNVVPVNRRDPHLLVLRLVTGARVAPQLSRVRNDQVIARSPSTRRLLDDEHRGAGHRLACQVQKRRCLHGPVHPDFAQPLNSSADLVRVEGSIDRLIRDHDFRPDVW